MKKKTTPKTKEQIAREMSNKQEVARKRKVIVENFYPALIKATVSVDEAKMLISSMTSLIMEGVLETMKQRKFAEMYESMVTRLCPDGERKAEIIELLDTVKGENLFVAREIIEGMSRAIEQMTMDEMRNRTLDSMKADWDRYLN